MLVSMSGADGEVERAFNQKFVPDSYELINVYKLYDTDLTVEDHIEEVKKAEAAEESKRAAAEEESKQAQND